MMKKVFALLMALMMVLGMGAASAADTTSAVQIVEGYFTTNSSGQLSGFVDKDASDFVYSNATYKDVIVSKTIAETSTENVFDITLTVESKQEVKQTTSYPDAAVVFALDISSSMSDQSIAAMQDAVDTFLDEFKVNNSSFGARKAAIVTFDATATVWSDWTDATSLAETIKAPTKEYDKDEKFIGYTIYDENRNSLLQFDLEGSGTNTTGGLLAADWLYETNPEINNYDYKYIILMTDGDPYEDVEIDENNRVLDGKGNIIYVNPTTETYRTNPNDPSSQISVTGWHDNGKLDLSEGRKSAETAAGYIANDIELFAIGYELVTSSSNWLKTKIADDEAHFFEANINNIVSKFNEIVNTINLKATPWLVTDPMGANISIVDGSYASANEGVTVSGNTLFWDLSKQTPKTNGDAENGDGITTYTYTTKYQIKLDNLTSGFDFTKNYNTNNATYLEYWIEEDGKFLKPDHTEIKDPTSTTALNKVYFNVPAVKGYKADLTFKKVDDAGNPISDVAFTLALNESGKTWANQPANAVKSDANGVVTFTNIPSGHSYILTETVPDGYSAASKTVGFDVAYGEIANHNFTDANNELTVVNTRDKGSLTFTKKFAETSDITASNWPADKTIAFAIKDADGNTKNVTLPVKNEDGTYSWTTTVSGLATGTATVTETITAIDGYTAAKVEDVTVNVTTKETVAAEITNTYTRNKGSLIITKDFATASAINKNNWPAGKTITFTVTDADKGTHTVTLPVLNEDAQTYSWTATINSIPTGEATVAETLPKIENYTLVEPVAKKVTVTEGDTPVTVAFADNTYTQDVGYIKVTKTFAGEAAAIPASIQVNVKNAAGEVVDTLTLSGETWVATSKALPVGSYSVEEVNAEVNGYILTATAAKDVKVTKGDPTPAEIVNKYTKNTTISKTATGLGEGATYPNPTIVLTKGSDKTEVALTANGGAAAVALVPGTYTLTETVAEVPYYMVSTTAEINNGETTITIKAGETFTVEAGKSYTVTVKNVYTRTEANVLNVKVNKIVDDSDSDVKAPTEEKVFSFTGKLFRANANNAVMLAAENLVEPETAAIVVGNDTFVGKLDEGINFNFTITTNGSGTYTVPVAVKVNEEDLEGLMLTIAEVDDNNSPYWHYGAESKTLPLEDGIEFEFVNTYLENSYDGLRIPFSKTVVQTGTAEPGTNTFYFSYFAWNENGDVDVTVCNDPLNKYGKVEVVKNSGDMDIIAITVDGANTVNGYFKVSGKDSELPDYISVQEMNGLEFDLTEEELKAAGWAYDITTFPYDTVEIDGETFYRVHCWNAYLGKDESGERFVRISRSDDGDAAKDEMAFVNTYSADKELPPPPKTGDNSNIALWLALMSASALCFVIISKRRNA